MSIFLYVIFLYTFVDSFKKFFQKIYDYSLVLN